MDFKERHRKKIERTWETKKKILKKKILVNFTELRKFKHTFK